MHIYDEVDRQEYFISEATPVVAAQEIEHGDDGILWEALGPDGFDAYYSRRLNGEARRKTGLAELRRALATKDHTRIGELVEGFVTDYFEHIAYESISDDLEAYGYEF